MNFFERQPLRTPITLGVVMIVLVVTLAGIWIATNVLALTRPVSINFWIPLAIGGVLLAAVLAGVIAYLTLTVKAVNLNRRQSNFIDSVTHELKSPIASLKLYLQTMTRHEVGQQQRDDFHEFMLADVERLDSLINHLLDVARVQRVEGRPDTDEITKFDLDDLLRQCGSATCARYSVDDDVVRVASCGVVVHQSPVQAEILFRNLIDNAIKYGGSPPEVIVTPSADATHATVVIDDNGAGIAPSLRRKVFGRFVRLGSELERSRPGTGLGLFLVRTTVKSLGGTVRITDRQDGPGSRFEVKMPLHAK